MLLNELQDFKFPKLGYIKLPEIPANVLPEKYRSMLSPELLRSLAYDGLLEKIASGVIPADKEEQYRERLEKELSIVLSLKFEGYFLLIWSIINFCKKNNILNGYSRGCFTETTPIQTARGRICIKDIQVGETVYNTKQDSVLAVFSFPYNGNVYNFSTANDFDLNVYSTPDHKYTIVKKDNFASREKEDVKAEDIRVGDYLVKSIILDANYTKVHDWLVQNKYCDSASQNIAESIVQAILNNWQQEFQENYACKFKNIPLSYAKDICCILESRGCYSFIKTENGQHNIYFCISRDYYCHSCKEVLGSNTGIEVFSRVNKINISSYNGLVYDLAVKDSPYFNTANSLVHNSCGGCLTFFLIDVIGIDPIKYDLLFERFISAERAKTKEIDGEIYVESSSLPDVDIDSQFKEPVLKFIQDSFPNRTCSISTNSCLTGKSLLRDVLKSYKEYKPEKAQEITDMLEKRHGIVESISDALVNNPRFSVWAKNNPDVIEIALGLENLYRQKGVHASGVLLLEQPVGVNVPVEMSQKGELATAFDMSAAQLFGIKVDNLGVETLSLVADILKRVGISMKDINVEHPDIYKWLELHDYYYGLFQISEGVGYQTVRKVKPKNLSELALCLALGRPGAMRYIDKYVKVKNNEETIYVHPNIESILKPTAGAIVYQEQLMALARKMADFTPTESDKLRKCLHGDTYFVSKQRGYVSLKDLHDNGYEDDLFLVMDKAGNHHWKKIAKIWKTGIKETRRVAIKNGMYIPMTRDHSVLTSNGFMSLKKLSKNSLLTISNKIDFDGKKTLSDNEIFILTCLSSYSSWKQKGLRIDLANKDIQDKAVQILQEMFGDNSFVFEKKIIKLEQKAEEHFGKYLDKSKFKQMEVPPILLGLDKESMAKMLALIFECNSVGRDNKEINLRVNSSKYLNQVQLMLLRYGVQSRMWDFTRYGKHVYTTLTIEKSNRDIFNKCIRPYFISPSNRIVYKFASVAGEGLEKTPHNYIVAFKKKYPQHFPLQKHRIRMTRKEFNTYCLNSNDSFWTQFAQGSASFYSLNGRSDVYSLDDEVYDFTMEDSKYPYIVANGFVAHNCIGKKLVHEMPKYEEQFTKGCLANKYPEEYIKQIWASFVDSASYSFNKSHAVGYATLTAVTTYLKLFYTEEFFLACLNQAKNSANADSTPLDQIAKIQRELKYFGVKLVGPHLVKSSIDFVVKDKEIIYGLKTIKGISENTLEKVIKFQGEYTNKVSCFIAAKQAGLTIQQLCSLIQSGCLDGFAKSRCRFVLEAQTYNLLTEREKNLVAKYTEQNDNDLLKTIKWLVDNADENGKKYIKASRFETIKKDYDKYKQMFLRNSQNEALCNFIYERNLLGFSFSNTLYDIFKPHYVDLENIRDIQQNAVNDSTVCCVGFISEYKISKAKSGKKYIKFDIHDDTGIITILCFRERVIADFENKYKDKELKNEILVVTGSKKSDAIFADSVFIQEINVYMKISELHE